MRQILIPIGALSMLLAVGAAATFAAPGDRRAARQGAQDGPCGQVTAACESAGFARGAGKGGAGLQVDCVAPIMQGRDQPKRARVALPHIDPQVVEACKASNPAFGQGRGPAAEPVVQAPPSPPPVAGAPSAPAPGAAAPRVPPQAAAGGVKRPNIIFILTDDLALNLVQYMPHVVKMQKDGVTFANYFVTDSLCCPSRSSIFTGRFPHDTGIFTNTGKDGGFQAFHNRHHEQMTFATALATAGYRTAMMGKYLNGYKPQTNPPEPGWSLWEVAGNGYPQYHYDFNDNGRFQRAGNQPSDYLTDVLAAKAVDFVKQSAGQPFAIEVATFSPHAPYTPAPRDANAFPDLRAPRTPAFNAAAEANMPQWLRTHPALSDADMAGIDRDFRKRAQSVQAVDKMIGELRGGGGFDRRGEQYLFRVLLRQRLSHGRAPYDARKDDGLRYRHPCSADRHRSRHRARARGAGDRRQYRSQPDLHRDRRRRHRRQCGRPQPGAAAARPSCHRMAQGRAGRAPWKPEGRVRSGFPRQAWRQPAKL